MLRFSARLAAAFHERRKSALRRNNEGVSLPRCVGGSFAHVSVSDEVQWPQNLGYHVPQRALFHFFVQRE